MESTYSRYCRVSLDYSHRMYMRKITIRMTRHAQIIYFHRLDSCHLINSNSPAANAKLILNFLEPKINVSSIDAKLMSDKMCKLDFGVSPTA